MRSQETPSPNKPFVPSVADPPIKMPNPPDEKQPEVPKVGSRDAPGGQQGSPQSSPPAAI